MIWLQMTRIYVWIVCDINLEEVFLYLVLYEDQMFSWWQEFLNIF